MSTRGRIAKNGGPIIAVSRIFYNSRDREKFIGSPGELVADICECDSGDGSMVAKLYLHTGCQSCGGIPVVADGCDGAAGGVATAEEICAALSDLPFADDPIEGIDLQTEICEALDTLPISADPINT